MGFVLYHMDKLHHIFNSYNRGVFIWLSGSSVEKHCFSVYRKTCFFKLRNDIAFFNFLKNRNSYFLPQAPCSPAKMSLQKLSQIHSGKYRNRRNYNVNGGPV